MVTVSNSHRSGLTYRFTTLTGAFMEFTDYLVAKLVVLALAAFLWGLFVSPRQEAGQSDTSQNPADRLPR